MIITIQITIITNYKTSEKLLLQHSFLLWWKMDSCRRRS